MLRLAICLLTRAQELCPIELCPVEFFFDTLECSIANSTIGPQCHQLPPLGIRRSAHYCNVNIPAVADCRVLKRSVIRLHTVAGNLCFRTAQLERIAIADECGGLSSWAYVCCLDRCPQCCDSCSAYLALNHPIILKPQAKHEWPQCEALEHQRAKYDPKCRDDDQVAVGKCSASLAASWQRQRQRLIAEAPITQVIRARITVTHTATATAA